MNTNNERRSGFSPTNFIIRHSCSIFDIAGNEQFCSSDYPTLNIEYPMMKFGLVLDQYPSSSPTNTTVSRSFTRFDSIIVI